MKRNTKRKYFIPSSKIDRKKIAIELINKIKLVQKQLQMKENLKFGSKAQKVTFYYASREVVKKIK